MISIVFICHGNICRSPAAEMIFLELLRRRKLEGRFAVSSMAVSDEETGNDVYPPMKRVLEKHRIPCPRRAARRMTAADYDRFDHIIAMDGENMWLLDRITGDDPARKCSLLLSWCGRPGQEVSDPWYTRDFERAFQDILAGCEGLLDSLSGQA